VLTSPPRALLIDFDGVLRVFEQAGYGTSLSPYGVTADDIAVVALAEMRLRPAITGQMTRQQWLAGVAEHFADQVGGLATAEEMVGIWAGYRGVVVPEVLELVREVRAAGRPVALVTNATDDLHTDLAQLELTDAFDAVVSSYEVRAHKPSKEYFTAACQAVGVLPADCLVVDDADRNVRGARAMNMRAMRWSGVGDLPYVRAALGR